MADLDTPILDPTPEVVPVKAVAGKVDFFWPPPRTRRGARAGQQEGAGASADTSVAEAWAMVQAPSLEPNSDEESEVELEDDWEGDLELDPLLEDGPDADLVERALDAVLEGGAEDMDAEAAGLAVGNGDEPALGDVAEAPEPALVEAALPLEGSPAEAMAPAEHAPARPGREAPIERVAAECSVDLPGLGAYHHSKRAFEAHCHCNHGKCVLSRTSQPPAQAGQVGRGRPLGFMTCWLQHGPACDSKAAHWDKDAWRANFSQQLRLEARGFLLGWPGAEALFACERVLADGEDEEPPSLQGLV